MPEDALMSHLRPGRLAVGQVESKDMPQHTRQLLTARSVPSTMVVR